MKRYKIQFWVFLVCLIVVSLLILFSYLGVVANDEGHATKTTLLLEKLFSILSFPTVNLISPLLKAGWGVPYILLIGLSVNALLYAFLIERIYSWISKKRK